MDGVKNGWCDQPLRLLAHIHLLLMSLEILATNNDAQMYLSTTSIIKYCMTCLGQPYGVWLHGHLDCCQKPTLGGMPNTKPGDHVTPNAHDRQVLIFYHV